MPDGSEKEDTKLQLEEPCQTGRTELLSGKGKTGRRKETAKEYEFVGVEERLCSVKT